MNMVQRMSRDAAEAFWSQLPSDGFAEEEAELLELLQNIARLLQSWLPSGISLQDWAKKRVPQEFAFDINASRLAYIQPPLVRHSAEQAIIRDNAGQTRAPLGPLPPPAPPPGLPRAANSSKVRLTAPRVVPPRSTTGSQELETRGAKKESFLDSLPDEKLPWEDMLHRALAVSSTGGRKCGKVHLKRLEGWQPLAAIEKEPTIVELVKDNLPQGTSFRGWIEKRTGGEFLIKEDDKYGATIKYDGLVGGRAGHALVAQDFLDSLPPDEFTPEEENLRNAIYEFLEEWQRTQGSVPATTYNIGNCPSVNDAKLAVLPSAISLKRWCESRLFDEIEFLEGDQLGQVAVGFKGQLDHEAAQQLFASQPRKKPRHRTNAEP